MRLKKKKEKKLIDFFNKNRTQCVYSLRWCRRASLTDELIKLTAFNWIGFFLIKRIVFNGINFVYVPLWSWAIIKHAHVTRFFQINLRYGLITRVPAIAEQVQCVHISKRWYRIAVIILTRRRRGALEICFGKCVRFENYDAMTMRSCLRLKEKN